MKGEKKNPHSAKIPFKSDHGNNRIRLILQCTMFPWSDN